MGGEDTRGRLERRRVTIDDTSIHYIGKETNKLEEDLTLGVDPEDYTEYVDWKRGDYKPDL